jgi:hypothetical protein
MQIHEIKYLILDIAIQTSQDDSMRSLEGNKGKPRGVVW